VEPQGQVTIDVAYVLTHVQKPYPTHISQANSNQFVVYTDSIYLLSPYTVAAQKTTIQLPTSAAIESFSQEDIKPAPIQQGDTVVYGSFHNIKPLQARTLKVHYENNSGGARTMEIGPIRNQNLISWPLANDLSKLARDNKK